eukprot:3914100-Prymnesium_polylepis.1
MPPDEQPPPAVSDANGPPIPEATAAAIAEAADPQRRAALTLTLWCQRTVRGGPSLPRRFSGHAAAAIGSELFLTGGAAEDGTLSGETLRRSVGAVRWMAPIARKEQYKLVAGEDGQPEVRAPVCVCVCVGGALDARRRPLLAWCAACLVPLLACLVPPAARLVPPARARARRNVHARHLTLRAHPSRTLRAHPLRTLRPHPARPRAPAPFRPVCHPQLFEELQVPPLPSSSHTATLCGDLLYLLGGTEDDGALKVHMLH